MRVEDAKRVFGTEAEIARAAGVSRQAVNQWDELVPPLSAAKLAARSAGKLTFDPDVYEGWYRPKEPAA